MKDRTEVRQGGGNPYSVRRTSLREKRSRCAAHPCRTRGREKWRGRMERMRDERGKFIHAGSEGETEGGGEQEALCWGMSSVRITLSSRRVIDTSAAPPPQKKSSP